MLFERLFKCFGVLAGVFKKKKKIIINYNLYIIFRAQSKSDVVEKSKYALCVRG